MYDDDDIYGDNSGMSDDLAGLTIIGGDDLGGMDDNDAAAQWLADQMMGDPSGNDGISPVSDSELMGAATNADLQLGRISHVEPRIQAGIKHVLEGGGLYGTHPVDLAAAREEFASVIGGDPKAFARQIKVDEAVNVPAHKQDIATVMSMLGNTAGAYLERGPGGQMINTHTDAERGFKADEDFGTAVGYVKELADLYLDGRTRGTTVEPARRQALEESITKRLIDGTFYEGSKDLLPLPNETGVTGIKATQGIYGTAQGTAEDRLSAAGRFDHLYQTVDGQGQKTRFKRDDQGFRTFRPEVTLAEKNAALRGTPSLANSLFPKPRRVKDKTYSQAELDKQKRDQKYAMEQAQYKADFARKVLRQQMPSNRDESKGQIRMTGWDAPVDDQADLQELRNEAAIQDVDWNTTYAGQGEASRGVQLQSELTTYIEEATNTLSADTNSNIAQGTQAWLDQRKGKITASTAAGLLKEGGVEERAMELAMERLGTAEKFMGNAHTREGNDGEDKARRAFMSGPGRGMNYAEAYFEENENYAGFGVSPDGRLYDDEGDSKGLLELKYLSSGSMAGALNKYTPQMQMQMAITGETETHFYALDKYTGEYVHERVQADSDMQSKLIKAGTAALSMGAELDNRGVQALRKQIQSAAKPRKKLSLKGEETGQTAAFVSEDAVEEVMTAFDPRVAAVERITQSTGRAASDTKLAQKLESDDQRARMKDAVDAAQPDAEVAFDRVENQRKQAAARNAFVDAQRPQGMNDDERGEMASFYKQQEADAKKAEKEKQAAQKETTENLRNFGRALNEAAGVAGELAGLAVGGMNTGMSEVRAGAEAGMTAAQSRGSREALELGSLSDQGAIATISRAGQLQQTFNDRIQGAAQFTNFMQDRGTSGNAAVRGLSLPSSPQEFASMTPQQLMQKVAMDVTQASSPEDKQAIANFYGMPEMAVFDGDPAALSNKDGSIGEARLRETNRQYQGVMQTKREVLEEGAEVVSGEILAGAGIAAGVIGSKTMGFVGSKASNFMSMASKTGPKAANAVKSLSTAAKATPAAALASAVPMAARYAAGVEDDGGMADSALDVMEFAAYGAAAGSIVPGVGTAVGAGVGAAVGVANEAWDWFNADDAVPKADIGPMQSQTREQSSSRSQEVNVSVVNEISPELITTTTDVDGDISVDSDSSLSTGG